MACLIDKAALFDCSALVAAGIKPDLVLISKSIWDDAINGGTITRDGTDNFIDSLALTSGDQGFQFSFPKSSSLIPSTPIRIVENGVDTFDHSIQVRAFDVSQGSRESIAKMRFDQIVAVFLKNNGRGEVWGEGVGMRMSEFDYQPGDPGLGNSIIFTLVTPGDGPGEIQPPSDFYNTNAATTLVQFDALKSAAA